MSSFEVRIREAFGVNEKDLQIIRSYFTAQEMLKDSFLVRKDQYCDRLIFLKEGHFRVYRQHSNKEVTQWISSPSYFLTDFTSFFFGMKSRWNIQAISDVSFFSISTADYKKLNTDFEDWCKIEKQFIAHCFIQLEERVNQLISLSSEERYLLFYAQNKALFNQVPLQYIASMLGMTPETLSRIRKKSIS